VKVKLGFELLAERMALLKIHLRSSSIDSLSWFELLAEHLALLKMRLCSKVGDSDWTKT